MVSHVDPPPNLGNAEAASTAGVEGTAAPPDPNDATMPLNTVDNTNMMAAVVTALRSTIKTDMAKLTTKIK